MRENRLRTIWQQGKAAVNGWLHIPSAWSAEVMAHQGYDSLTVDMEHGMAGFERALGMLQAISTTGVTPLARASWNEPGIVMRLLDAGSMGIICPMVNTRGQAVASRAKTGRNQVTAPIFLLVPQAKLPKRLDLDRDAERALHSVPGLIVANWVEGRIV